VHIWQWHGDQSCCAVGVGPAIIGRVAAVLTRPSDASPRRAALQVIEVMYGNADFVGDVCIDRSIAASDV